MVLDERELPQTSGRLEEDWWAQGRGFSAWGDGKDPLSGAHLYGMEAAAENITEPGQSRRGGEWQSSATLDEAPWELPETIAGGHS